MHSPSSTAINNYVNVAMFYLMSLLSYYSWRNNFKTIIIILHYLKCTEYKYTVSYIEGKCFMKGILKK